LILSTPGAYPRDMEISLFEFAVTHIEPELAREFGADWLGMRECPGSSGDLGWPLDLSPREWEAEFLAWLDAMGR
jgi:hypothetical protein